MGAREKLNAAAVWGCLIISAILGAAMESWGAFWGILIVLIAICHVSGEIRTHPDARHPETRRGGGRRPTRGR